MHANEQLRVCASLLRTRFGHCKRARQAGTHARSKCPRRRIGQPPTLSLQACGHAEHSTHRYRRIHRVALSQPCPAHPVAQVLAQNHVLHGTPQELMVLEHCIAIRSIAVPTPTLRGSRCKSSRSAVHRDSGCSPAGTALDFAPPSTGRRRAYAVIARPRRHVGRPSAPHSVSFLLERNCIAPIQAIRHVSGSVPTAPVTD